MTRLNLRPDHLAVLTAIVQKGPIKVADLANYLEYDRGTIEAAVGSLESAGHVEKTTNVEISHVLTSRGKISSNGLPERKIIECLQNKSIRIEDLGEKSGLEKGDLTAGIGILLKNGIISISQGEISLTNHQRTSLFSMDLQNALISLADGNYTIDKQIETELISRGLIRIVEKSIAIVSSQYTMRKIASAQVIEEITKLTPKLISSGAWKHASFKPYSLKTKARMIYGGRLHPYREFLEHLKSKLVGLGFVEMKGPIVEQEFWNFDALYAPQDHASREDSDILLIDSPSFGKLVNKNYVNNVTKTHENGWKTGSLGHRYKWDPVKASRLLLRPQGTSISARTLPKLRPPAKYFSIAKCYRPDQVDATHAIEFYQTEGIICDPDITFKDLLGMLETFAVEVAGAKDIRFRPDYYPFTSPSVELSARHPVLGSIEFGGAGIFRPEVTQPFGIDYPILAWGIGVERLFMTNYNISDIRELYSQNLEWLRTEKVSSSISLGGN